MFALGRGRVDSDFEDWVLWRLPLTRALQYHHAALRYAGEWTVPIEVMGSDDKVLAALDAIAALNEDEDEDDDLASW